MCNKTEGNVRIGLGAVIEPYVIIKGDTVIGEGAYVGSFSYLENAVIGNNCTITASRIVNSGVGNGTTVGPNAHLRNNTIVGRNCRIGNYVEIKNSLLKDGCKAAHLAYIGDATIGLNCNVGCGVVFVNYDGKTKHKTIVGDDCFIGSNSNIIAPVNIGNDCFIACGTTVTEDMADGDFAIGRSKATIKKGRYYLKNKK